MPAWNKELSVDRNKPIYVMDNELIANIFALISVLVGSCHLEENFSRVRSATTSNHGIIPESEQSMSKHSCDGRLNKRLA